mmetsp:Transcript_85482/g.275150  ORF Transcript_85482/g.275150 Transcript_85482/m.275150 type:complete len:225 (+) Transcript_85482:256-930(+)
MAPPPPRPPTARPRTVLPPMGSRRLPTPAMGRRPPELRPRAPGRLAAPRTLRHPGYCCLLRPCRCSPRRLSDPHSTSELREPQRACRHGAWCPAPHRHCRRRGAHPAGGASLPRWMAEPACCLYNKPTVCTRHRAGMLFRRVSCAAQSARRKSRCRSCCPRPCAQNRGALPGGRRAAWPPAISADPHRPGEQKTASESFLLPRVCTPIRTACGHQRWNAQSPLW